VRGQPSADRDEWTRLEAIVHFGPNTRLDKVMENEAVGEKIRGNTKVGEMWYCTLSVHFKEIDSQCFLLITLAIYFMPPGSFFLCHSLYGYFSLNI
jgi:hypothetical protein